ncbi:MAG TPA: hypothetical protein VEI80_03090 [Candidatus Acidoferrales bacterium]|nr:hypothetical protein [Candidatus Acidoferrales bacterium]
MPVKQTQTPNEEPSPTTPILLQLQRPLLDYRIIIAVLKGDVGAINILKDALNMSKELNLPNPILALGPTTPLSLNPPPAARILWATFTDNSNTTNGQRFTVIQPNHLTDISLSLEKLSKTRNGRVPLIIGDFLDNVLSVSSSPTGLYSFLCKLFTRIRTNEQTAFLLATDDMHDAKKTAILRRFADLIIEYNSVEDMAEHRVEARILDHLQNQYGYWDNAENPKPDLNHFDALQRTIDFGRRYSLQMEQPNLGH